MLFQALLKIIKHCHEEAVGSTDVAQGVLLGLMVEDALEITNCFPFPSHADDLDVGESMGSGAYITQKFKLLSFPIFHPH